MKSANCKVLYTAVAALTMAFGAVAGDNSTSNPALGVLSSVGSAELPAKASELVAQSNAKNLKQTTIDVVKAAVGLNPAAAPAIVGSISHATPSMAPTACATSVVMVPNQVLLIACAAAAACPTNAGAIVEAICRVLPADYKEVAEAVAGVVPGAGREILAGIAAAIPQLRGVIDQTLASYQNGIPSVSTVLGQVEQSSAASTIVASSAVATTPSGAPTPVILPRGPSTGAPFVPITGTPTSVTPGSGGASPPPPGYSAP